VVECAVPSRVAILLVKARRSRNHIAPPPASHRLSQSRVERVYKHQRLAVQASQRDVAVLLPGVLETFGT
jgi:hypothetical protein